MSRQRPGVEGLVCCTAAWCSNSKAAQRLCLSVTDIMSDGKIKIHSSTFLICLLFVPPLLFSLSDQVKLTSRSIISCCAGAGHTVTTLHHHMSTLQMSGPYFLRQAGSISEPDVTGCEVQLCLCHLNLAASWRLHSFQQSRHRHHCAI